VFVQCAALNSLSMQRLLITKVKGTAGQTPAP
jgi:hypothetical protein